ncbi:MAG: hypothetical protein V1855_04505 [bacterium]
MNNHTPKQVDRNYRSEDRWLRIPGIIKKVFFVLAFLGTLATEAIETEKIRISIIHKTIQGIVIFAKSTDTIEKIKEKIKKTMTVFPEKNVNKVTLWKDTHKETTKLVDNKPLNEYFPNETTINITLTLSEDPEPKTTTEKEEEKEKEKKAHQDQLKKEEEERKKIKQTTLEELQKIIQIQIADIGVLPNVQKNVLFSDTETVSEEALKEKIEKKNITPILKWLPHDMIEEIRYFEPNVQYNRPHKFSIIIKPGHKENIKAAFQSFKKQEELEKKKEQKPASEVAQVDPKVQPKEDVLTTGVTDLVGSLNTLKTTIEALSTQLTNVQTVLKTKK